MQRKHKTSLPDFQFHKKDPPDFQFHKKDPPNEFYQCV